VNRRLQLIIQSLRKGTTGGGLGDWLLNCLGPPCGVLARRRILRNELRDGFRELEIEGAGGVLYVDPAIPERSLHQTIAEQCYTWQWHYYQVPETRVGPDDRVVDCGSAEGLFPFLTHAVATEVVCFEPLPEFVRGLHRTFDSDPRVRIVPSALGESPGSAYLRRSGISSSITTEVTDTPVAMDTIDAYCERTGFSPSYLKADMEGYEMPLLKGASRTIARLGPKIAITTYHQPGHADEIEGFLKGLAPSYRFKRKGVESGTGAPVMLHAWQPCAGGS
jgi:FkbM family methyltransferase